MTPSLGTPISDWLEHNRSFFSGADLPGGSQYHQLISIALVAMATPAVSRQSAAAAGRQRPAAAAAAAAAAAVASVASFAALAAGFAVASDDASSGMLL